MIGYRTSGRKKHVIKEPDARRAFAPFHAFLVSCTDSLGPWGLEGVPIDRYEALRNPPWSNEPKPSTLGALQALVDELVRDGRPCSLALQFGFRLCELRGPLLPYGEPQLDARGVDTRSSALSLELKHGRDTECSLDLWWPFDQPTAAWATSHDAVFGTLGLQPTPEYWRRGDPTLCREFDVDRGALEPPPVDEVGARLHAAVLESPQDTGARLAYADWLTLRGDPLGEILVVQVELATVTDKRRKTALRARTRELLAAHGLRWSRLLVPR